MFACVSALLVFHRIWTWQHASIPRPGPKVQSIKGNDLETRCEIFEHLTPTFGPFQDMSLPQYGEGEYVGSNSPVFVFVHVYEAWKYICVLANVHVYILSYIFTKVNCKYIWIEVNRFMKWDKYQQKKDDEIPLIECADSICICKGPVNVYAWGECPGECGIFIYFWKTNFGFHPYIK